MNNVHPKTIVVVSTSPAARGGIASVVRMMMDSDLKEKYQFVHVATHTNGNAFVKSAIFLHALIQYVWLLAFRKFSIVHIHATMKTSFLRKASILLLGKIFGKSVLLHMHSATIDEYFSSSSKLKASIVRKLLNRYDRIIAISEKWRETLSRYTKSPINVVYNPVDLTGFVRSFEHKAPLTVLTLGEIGERKGTDVLIQAARLLAGVDVRFKCFGNGDTALYKEKARAAGVEGRVEFPGWISGSEKEKTLRESDIFFLPSKFEGLPMSVLEACNFSLPVVATPVGGIPELIEEGVSGFLVAPDDAGLFARRIQELAADPALRERLGKAGRDAVEKKCDLRLITRQISAIYEDLLEKKR